MLNGRINLTKRTKRGKKSKTDTRSLEQHKINRRPFSAESNEKASSEGKRRKNGEGEFGPV